MKTRGLSLWMLLAFVATSVGCGSQKPQRSESTLLNEFAAPRHDYAATWVYAIGEVETPSASDCAKAFGFIEAESNCSGAACKYVSSLIKDYEHACSRLAPVPQRQKAAELRSRFAPRTGQVPSDCAREVDEWLDRGCGKDGACEPAVQSFATRCWEEIQSPLAMLLLERLVENSLREPRRVKFDLRSCNEYKAKLEQAAQCEKPFDCEDVLPRIDDYLTRCAEGSLKAVPLVQAAQIVRIRLGAGKPVEPIALTNSMSRLVTLSGTVLLADGTGAVMKVCGETVAELESYLSQRQKCEGGELTALVAVESSEGSVLELRTLWHESEAAFANAHPKLLVVGEVEARAQRKADQFVASMVDLADTAGKELASAFERANELYAALPPELRQSPKLYEALAVHDAKLVQTLAHLGDQKARIASKRSDAELIGLGRRTDKLVFADVNTKGVVEHAKTCELSELMLDQALPQSFAAYRQRAAKVHELLQKRNIVPDEDMATIRQTLMTFSQACSSARTQVTEAQKEVVRCAESSNACSADERAEAAAALENARQQWRAARVREIVAKVSMSQRELPSAVCSSW